MTNSSVPSTLVKCLYLFFDLPQVVEDANAEKSDSEFSPKERRILLQKMFIQVLIRLSAYIPAVEELARKDDLTLLFSAVTSPCSEHNLMWRKTAADVLLTISRHSLSPTVISYLHSKKLRSNATIKVSFYISAKRLVLIIKKIPSILQIKVALLCVSVTCIKAPN